MPNYTTNLNLSKPTDEEQYDIEVYNDNMDIIDNFAGQIPARALTADTLTNARKINGINFKGNADIITGLGLHSDIVTYNQNNLAYKVIDDEVIVKRCLSDNTSGNNFDDNTKWENVQLGGSKRNIGEIIQSTIPLSDADLHLLDGSLLSGSGTYSAFVDYIADIYDADSNYFCTEADWQTSVTAYGVCGKFVYDSINNTVRLPKITGFVEGTTSVSNLGDLVEAGLPNITGVAYGDEFPNTLTCEGAFYNAGNKSNTTVGDTRDSIKLGFDASLSNSIYGNSDTVQPQSVKILHYIVISTTTKTEIQADIDEIASDLNGKVDVDGTNFNQSVKNFDGKWVKAEQTLSSATGSSTTTVTSTLQSILPDDDYNYILKIKYNCNYGSAAASVTLDNESTTVPNIGFIAHLTSNCTWARGYIDVVVDSTRTLKVIRSAALTNCTVDLCGYRRLGTNK